MATHIKEHGIVIHSDEEEYYRYSSLAGQSIDSNPFVAKIYASYMKNLYELSPENLKLGKLNSLEKKLGLPLTKKKGKK